MQRCITLASSGIGYVAPNPMVGAVLVHDGLIVGEGYHQKYGEAHSEVNAINSAIAAGHESLLTSTTLYVSLEPCAHFGKTPPCADLIIKHQIPRVVIGCRDPFPEVDGKGIEKLQTAGIDLTTGVLEKDCIELNKRFFTFHNKRRPYIILKWAQTSDGIIGKSPGKPAGKRLLISNEYSNRLVHKWRSEEAAILIGTNTALQDDPQLNNRLWTGPSPTRLVLDLDLKLPQSLKMFSPGLKTIVFNYHRHEEKGQLVYHQVSREKELTKQLMDALYGLRIQSMIVEGGSTLLQSFIDAGFWDEARVITNKTMVAGKGTLAPELENYSISDSKDIGTDHLQIYIHSNQ